MIKFASQQIQRDIIKHSHKLYHSSNFYVFGTSHIDIDHGAGQVIRQKRVEDVDVDPIPIVTSSIKYP